MQKEQTYLERVTEFQNIYQTELLPILKNYEKKRKRKLVVENLSILCTIFFLYFGIEGADHLTEIFPQISANWVIISSFCSIIIGIVCALIAYSIPGSFLSDIKLNCLPIILKSFPNLEWNQELDLISDSELDRSALFATYNKRKSDDSFFGSYKGVKFKLCETLLQYENYNGKRRSVETIFKGIVITFTSNKIIKNRTIIATRGDKTAKTSGWGIFAIFLAIAIQSYDLYLRNPELYLKYLIFGAIISVVVFFHLKNRLHNGEALDEVVLEDPKFCKKFVAYSSDQVEARYLITTSFMEKFQNLKTDFGAKKAKCSFYDDKIMIAISTNKNLFEVGSLWESLEDPKIIKRVFAELYAIYKIIDYFKFNEKKGL